MKNIKDLYKIGKKEKVWCYSIPLQKYVTGTITHIGEDEIDRWGDISYWVYLNGDTNYKYYDVLRKEDYIDRLKEYLDNIDKDIINFREKLENVYEEKSKLEDLILELEND